MSLVSGSNVEKGMSNAFPELKLMITFDFSTREFWIGLKRKIWEGSLLLNCL